MPIALLTAQPTLSTSASSNTLVGGPISDTATLSGGSSPTGTFTFTVYGPDDATCGTEVGRTVVAVGAAGSATSELFTPRCRRHLPLHRHLLRRHQQRARLQPLQRPQRVGGDRPLHPAQSHPNRTGDVMGPLTVNAGDSVQITSARVMGPVTVNPGGALTVVNSRISRGITANGPSFLSSCGAQVSGPSPSPALTVTSATVPVRIGDPANGCAGNRFAGDVTLTSNLAVTFGANIVSSSATINSNGPGDTVIKANTVYRALNCTGDNPLPTNAGQSNSAGSKTGQCSGL